MKKITIIGAGNGGVTAAYHFSKQGLRVCLYDHPDFSQQIDAINENRGIQALEGQNDTDFILSGKSEIEEASTSIEKALAFSNILVMIVPAFAQEIMFKSMLPFLTEKHLLLSMPGNYAGLVLDRVKRENGYEHLDITYADAMTIPWACRLFEPGVIGIMGIKKFIYVGVFPAHRAENVINTLNEFFPIPVKLLKNVIEAGLENINFGGHPLVTTLNMGLLENFKGQFNYYSDCVSPATDRVSAKKSRYITEDVPNILVPCYEFATMLGIKVPIIESCIHIASAFNDTNYFLEGRTLASMGLSALSKNEILKYIGS
ncbi:MAG: hypothetical protein B6241_13720 [Spirochaetaceae bacterium 4572_59]|nr:MAG: hypothetical protein B6241_13720 [Spirochaetaceae bacterium 4572_59]